MVGSRLPEFLFHGGRLHWHLDRRATVHRGRVADNAPPVVVGSRNWITPCAEVESDYFPQPEWMIDAIHERILPLSGHQMSTNPTTGELLKRQREGV